MNIGQDLRYAVRQLRGSVSGKVLSITADAFGLVRNVLRCKWGIARIRAQVPRIFLVTFFLTLYVCQQPRSYSQQKHLRRFPS